MARSKPDNDKTIQAKIKEVDEIIKGNRKTIEETEKFLKDAKAIKKKGEKIVKQYKDLGIDLLDPSKSKYYPKETLPLQVQAQQSLFIADVISREKSAQPNKSSRPKKKKLRPNIKLSKKGLRI